MELVEMLELDERVVFIDRPGAAIAAKNMMKGAFMVASDLSLGDLSRGEFESS